MNHISAELKLTKYTRDKILTINIDGQLLDEILDKLLPGKDIIGLIPTLDNELFDKKERMVVWNRILPPLNNKTIAPILMCPDDCDLLCSVIVVEITTTKDTIRWEKFGCALSKSNKDPNVIGSEVQWFEGAGPFIFTRDEYNTCINKFKDLLDQ